jgi:siderophore synthetase component
VTRDPAEEVLAARVVSTLLREDYGGLSRRVRRDGTRLTLALPAAGHGPARRLPLERDGFLADYRVAAGTPLTLDDVRSAVALLAGERDAGGAATFDAECRRSLAEARLRARHLHSQAGPGQDRDDEWAGPAGQLRYDALAATLPHPAYPASPGRLGLDDADLLAYAPEFRPEFALRWAAVPKEQVTRPSGQDQPAWWPAPARVGLERELAATHELFPVHPLTAARGRLSNQGALLAPEPYLTVRPTLSVRTVAVAADPAGHLKLPLPASTLGARNRRSLKPGPLADGALVYRLLKEIRDHDPALGGLLLADDAGYAHAGHPDLGYLRRRLPSGLDRSHVVPVAGLTARAPSGRLVLEKLAGRAGLDVTAFTSRYFRLVLGLAVRLLVRYGIALESHQQNAALVASPGAAPRLLVKDFDGTLINLARLRAALGPGAPSADDFDDQRMLTTSDDELADVFVTITVHLCVGALAFTLSEHGVAPLASLLAQARRAVNDALAAECSPAAARLRARVLDAPRLTGKSMLTAGTLTAKEHTGAGDINKFYGTTGPNYLKEAR